MADDRLKEAVDIVAHHALFQTISHEAGDLWESYPEVGEYDWEAVQDRITELLQPFRVDRESFEAAYEFLEQRAESHVD